MIEPEISGPYRQVNQQRNQHPGPTVDELKEELVQVKAERDLLLNIVRYSVKN